MNAVFCEESLGKTRRRCRSFSERFGPRIILLESRRIGKVHAHSHEITKQPFTSSNYENHDAEVNNSDAEKSTNRRKKNLEDEANNMQLDKEDTQRSNLNSKHLSVTLCVKKYPDSFICFYPAAGKCFQKARYLAV